MRVFITGTSGFIGFHLARRLLLDGHEVTGYDGMTDYYDIRLKRERLARLQALSGFRHVEGMLEDAQLLERSVKDSQADTIAHLAAQAGVRYSIDHPESYISANLVGTANLLQAARHHRPQHLLFASTSSIYGGNVKMPFAESDRADQPVSLYAATKKGGEAMVHAYSHLWDIPSTIVRFFTVYGPWGRPDMALFKFVSAIEHGTPIEIYGHGQMRRDFTYVDDLVEAVVRLMRCVPGHVPATEGDSLSNVAPCRTVNISGGQPRELMDFVAAIERALGRQAVRHYIEMQQGDSVATEADTSLLHRLVGHIPPTPVEVGIEWFVAWYRSHYAEFGGDDVAGAWPGGRQ